MNDNPKQDQSECLYCNIDLPVHQTKEENMKEFEWHLAGHPKTAHENRSNCEEKQIEKINIEKLGAVITLTDGTEVLQMTGEQARYTKLAEKVNEIVEWINKEKKNYDVDIIN